MTADHGSEGSSLLRHMNSIPPPLAAGTTSSKLP
jgi:hypothetical protein